VDGVRGGDRGGGQQGAQLLGGRQGEAGGQPRQDAGEVGVPRAAATPILPTVANPELTAAYS